MTDPDRLSSPARLEEDGAEASLRPQTLDDFTGQRGLRENLRVFIGAARARAEAMDHVLFHGPPGLGKTTLAQIVARELGVGFRATSGPVLQRAGDLAAILTNLQPRDVLFVDEIHRLQPAIEETLYPAMEDFQLDLIIGEGPAARTVRIDLPPFTLIGATTRAGLLATPLRDRFGIPLRLVLYTPEELLGIVTRGARKLGFVFQSFQLMHHMSAIENVMLPLELSGVRGARAQAKDMLERVGLGHERLGVENIAGRPRHRDDQPVDGTLAVSDLCS